MNGQRRYVSPMTRNTDLTGRGRASTPVQDRVLRWGFGVVALWGLFVFGVVLGRG